MKHCYSCQFWNRETMKCQEQDIIVSRLSPACEKHLIAEEFDNEKIRADIDHIQRFLFQFGYDKTHPEPHINGLQQRNEITWEMNVHVYQEIQKLNRDEINS